MLERNGVGTEQEELEAVRDELAAVRSELEALRARLAQLERERAGEISAAMEAAADAQDRVYWLDRWHVDLNAAVATPAGGALRRVMRAFRAPVRAVRLLARRVR